MACVGFRCGISHLDGLARHTSIHIVGELDGYGAACAYELRYRDDYDGEKGVLNLRELDVRWTRGVPLSAGIDVSAYVDRCLEDYCGWVAGPIQEL